MLGVHCLGVQACAGVPEAYLEVQGNHNATVIGNPVMAISRDLVGYSWVIKSAAKLPCIVTYYRRLDA